MVDASDVQSLPIDVSGLSGQTAPAPLMPQSPQDFQQAGVAPPAAPPSPWRSILQGALWGIASASQPGRGRGSFAEGLGQGAGGAIEGEQQQVENQMRQKQLQFESVQAGDSHIRALNEAQAADDAHQEHQLQLQNFQANIDAANEVFGVKPRLTLSADNGPDMHAQAGGALKTLAAANGGTIPEVVTTNDPATASSPTHDIDVYTKPTTQELTQNPSGFRALVDAARKADGQMPTTDQEWNTGGFSVKYGAPATEGLQMRAEQQAGQAKMVMDAYKRLYSPYGGESVVGGDSPSQVSSKNAGTAASLHQRADAYAKSPDANETVAKLLQTQADTFDTAVEDARQKAQAGVNKSTTEGAPAEAAAAKLKKEGELAADIDPSTAAGRLNLQQKQQDLLDKKYSNATQQQRALFDEGKDPMSGQTLNLSNAPDEFMVDERTGQPIPTKMLSTLKPTQQESNRADFANSTLHTMDLIDQLKQSGKLPNGPLTGLTEKSLAKAGLSSGDAQQAISYIALAQSAATGAHVGGRFNKDIMAKMGTLLNLNMNDGQFAGAETALRNVMTPYAQQGGRESVGQYKANLMGQTKVVNGKTYAVTGFDKNGQLVLTAGQ